MVVAVPVKYFDIVDNSLLLFSSLLLVWLLVVKYDILNDRIKIKMNAEKFPR